MPTIRHRIASAFAVFCGQYGDVTEMAKDRERSRQSLYREAKEVANAVDGAAARPVTTNNSSKSSAPRAEVQALQERREHTVEITPDKRHEFAAVAQAEGVSLSAARRLLQVVEGPVPPARRVRRRPFGPRLLNRPHFSQLHSDSTGRSTGA